MPKAGLQIHGSWLFLVMDPDSKILLSKIKLFFNFLIFQNQVKDQGFGLMPFCRCTDKKSSDKTSHGTKRPKGCLSRSGKIIWDEARPGSGKPFLQITCVEK